MTSPLRRLIGIAGLAFVVGVGTVSVMINSGHNVQRGAYAALTLGIGWGFTGAGLYVSRRRPGNNIGLLMTAVGFSAFLKGLTFSNDSAIFTIASLGEVLIYGVLVHLLLSFPSGRLESRLDRLLVAMAYFNTVVLQLAAFVFTDPPKAGCPHCPANLLLINHPEAATAISTAQLDIAIALLGAVVAVLYGRWRNSNPGQERAFTPVLAVGSLTFVLLMASLIVEQSNLSSKIAEELTLALFGSLACLPFAFLIGLLRSRFNQAEAISSLVGQLAGGWGSSRPLTPRARGGAWRRHPGARLLGTEPGRLRGPRRPAGAGRSATGGKDRHNDRARGPADRRDPPRRRPCREAGARAHSRRRGRDHAGN
jgi:hypothetical protein